MEVSSLIKAFNNSFRQIESIQYNAALMITGAIIRGTSKEKLQNLVSSLCNLEHGFENYLSFTKW